MDSEGILHVEDILIDNVHSDVTRAFTALTEAGLAAVHLLTDLVAVQLLAKYVQI
jgi:hypothetical protein